MPMVNRTSQIILGLLNLAPMSGYDLKTTIADSVGNFWSESYGQLYPQLKKLEAQGCITGRDDDTAGLRKRRIYSITPEGRDVYLAWLSEPPVETPPRIELLLKLFFARNGDPADTRRMLRQIRDKRAQEIAGYEAKIIHLQREHEGHPDLPYWLATLRYGVLVGRGFIDWCDETLGKLSDGK